MWIIRVSMVGMYHHLKLDLGADGRPTTRRFAHIAPGPMASCHSWVFHSLKVTGLHHKGRVIEGKLGRWPLVHRLELAEVVSDYWPARGPRASTRRPELGDSKSPCLFTVLSSFCCGRVGGWWGTDILSRGICRSKLPDWIMFLLETLCKWKVWSESSPVVCRALCREFSGYFFVVPEKNYFLEV